MKSFRILSHTADIRLKAEASSLKELFSSALEGMNEIIKKDFCASEKSFTMKEEISVASSDTTALLIDFLSEVLSLSQQNHALYCFAEFSELKDKSLKAKLSGKKVDEFDEDIKAVTYHEADIKKNTNGRYETVVIFDI